MRRCPSCGKWIFALGLSEDEKVVRCKHCQAKVRFRPRAAGFIVTGLIVLITIGAGIAIQYGIRGPFIAIGAFALAVIAVAVLPLEVVP